MNRPALDALAAFLRATARRWAGPALTAEDAEQEAWLAALEAQRTFDPARGHLFRYLTPILRAQLGNLVAGELAAGALVAGGDGALDGLADAGASPEQLVAEAEARARAAAAMAEVLADLGERAAAMMAHPLDVPANEVAESVGVCAGRVREVRHLVRERVRARIAS